MLQEYVKKQKEKRFWIGTCFIFLWVAASFCMTIQLEQSWLDLPELLWRGMKGEMLTSSEKILLFLRFPRVLMGIVAGAGLSIAGAVMQSITRNPLVSPFTLGVSASAAFGASLCIVFGVSWMRSEWGLIGGAFLSASVCAFVVYGFASYLRLSHSSLVLIGIGMNYFFTAMSSTVEFFAAEYKLGEIIQWSFGTLNKSTWDSVGMVSGVVFLVMMIYHWKQLSLNALAQSSDEVVLSLGVNPRSTRLAIGGLAVLVTASIVSFTGVIGFVGLIGPHISRMLVGNDHRYFLPMSALSGAWLLLLSDTLGRFVLYPLVIPVGIVVSFLGVPLFLHLIVWSRKKGGI